MLPFTLHELETPPESCLNDRSREDREKEQRGPLPMKGRVHPYTKNRRPDFGEGVKGKTKRNKAMQDGSSTHIMPTGDSRQMFCTQQPCAAAMQSYKDMCRLETPSKIQINEKICRYPPEGTWLHKCLQLKGRTAYITKLFLGHCRKTAITRRGSRPRSLGPSQQRPPFGTYPEFCRSQLPCWASISRRRNPYH